MANVAAEWMAGVLEAGEKWRAEMAAKNATCFGCPGSERATVRATHCQNTGAHETCGEWASLRRFMDEPGWFRQVEGEAGGGHCARYFDLGRRLHDRERNWKGLAARGFPERLLDAVLEGELERTEAVGAALEFVQSPLTFLILLGGKGTGKTTAACVAGSRVKGSRFMKSHKVTRLDRFDDAAMSEVEKAPLLVIDDLGVEYMDVKGEAASRFDALLDERYDARRKTVITSNMNAADFTARYGVRIADRFREAGMVVNLTGESMRKKAG